MRTSIRRLKLGVGELLLRSQAKKQIDNAIVESKPLFEKLPVQRKQRAYVDKTSGSFIANTRLPVHRWFRYSAGFSAEWVAGVLEQTSDAANILDPFAGSGTVLVEAEKSGRKAIGADSHPLISRIAAAKLEWRSDPGDFMSLSAEVLAVAKAASTDKHLPTSSLIERCYTKQAQNELASIIDALVQIHSDSSAWRLCWLALVSIIRETSFVGTAQWQYVLPNKRKARVRLPLDAYTDKVSSFLEDMNSLAGFRTTPRAVVQRIDARKEAAAPEAWADLVITSPPYANNYDYADATRLEMTVLGEVAGWGELQSKVRPSLVRACTQHAAAEKVILEDVLARPEVSSIAKELGQVTSELAALKGSKGGKKDYDLMLACYFLDMSLVFGQLRRQVKQGGRMCFVIGDSAPYGVYAPVDIWLGQLAVQNGFDTFNFEKVRDRNTKWKNRKHQVPLKEGRLWING